MNLNSFINMDRQQISMGSLENIFYGVGVGLLFITVGYFLGSYLEYIPASLKAILIFLVSIILFVSGDILRRLDK